MEPDFVDASDAEGCEAEVCFEAAELSFHCHPEPVEGLGAVGWGSCDGSAVGSLGDDRVDPASPAGVNNFLVVVGGVHDRRFRSARETVEETVGLAHVGGFGGLYRPGDREAGCYARGQVEPVSVEASAAACGDGRAVPQLASGSLNASRSGPPRYLYFWPFA